MSYFWVYGRSKRDTPVLLGPYSSDIEADRMADQLEDGRVFPLETKNQSQATQRVKALLSETEGIGRHLRNYKHKETEGKEQTSISKFEDEVWRTTN